MYLGAKTTSTEKNFNYEVVDLVETYNFCIYYFFNLRKFKFFKNYVFKYYKKSQR